MSAEPTATAAASADLDALLAPISADSPAGESLRYDGLFDEIKELRREDDASLPQGVWKRELKRAEWDDVAAKAAEAIETRTKDLQLAGWLLEAWLHCDGFPGAVRGLRLVRRLCDDFWDDLHPQIEDGDLDFRLGPLRWLAERLPTMLKSVPVTRPDDDTPAYTWTDWEAAQHLAALADRAEAEEKVEDEGRVTQSKFLVSVSLSPAVLFARLADELAAVETALGELDRSLHERVEGEAPSFADARGTLEAIRAYVARNLEERIDEGELPPPGGPADGGGEIADEAKTAPRAGGRIRSRAEAYQRLNEAAEYLLRAEPHSPAPYLVRRAVSWGGMSLAELLAELLSKNADLDTIYELLGIRPIDT